MLRSVENPPKKPWGVAVVRHVLSVAIIWILQNANKLQCRIWLKNKPDPNNPWDDCHFTYQFTIKINNM